MHAFVAGRCLAVVPPPAQDEIFPSRRRDSAPDGDVGRAGRPRAHAGNTNLVGQHSTAPPVSNALPADRPFLHGGRAHHSGGQPVSPLNPTQQFFAGAMVTRGPHVHNSNVGAGASDGASGQYRGYMSAPAPSPSPPPPPPPPPPPRRSRARTAARVPPAAGAFLNDGGNVWMEDMPPASVSRPPPGALLDSARRLGQRRTRPTPGTETRSLSPTRQRQASPPPLTPVLPASRATCSTNVEAQLLEITRKHTTSLSTIKAELTNARKELVLTNNTMRDQSRKINNIATVVDKLALMDFSIRQMLVRIQADTAASRTVMESEAFNVSSANVGGATSVGPGVAALPPPQTQKEMEVQDAMWVLELKTALDAWLLDKFVKPGCAADVMVSRSESVDYARDWVINKSEVNASEAMRLLHVKWRLPHRPDKVAVGASATSGAPSPPFVPSPRRTKALQYVMRANTQLYQRIGQKATSVWASYINETRDYGTLRRLRGTRSKLEVFLRLSEAKLLLENDLFIKDSDSFDGIVRALAVVYSDLNVFHLFSETAVVGRTRRHVVCRLAHAALITTKIRAHLVRRSTAPERAEAAEGVDAADDEDDDADDDDDDDGDADDAGLQRSHSSGLNPGHRPLWVKELAILGSHLAAHGAAAVNGLRLSDGVDPLRAVVTRPAPVRAPPTPPAVATGAGTGGLSAGDVTAPARHAGVGSGGSFAAGAAAATANFTGSAAGVPQRAAAAGGYADSCSDETETDNEEEDQVPRRRKRTPAEMRAHCARRAVGRVIMEEVD